MTYVPSDYRVDRETTVQKLFQDVNLLVDAYSRYIDFEGAGFIRDYFTSLRLDLEQALEASDQRKARLIRHEVKQLCGDLQRRIDLAKRTQGEPLEEPCDAVA
jgi:hypothetical protein